jgi:hypothetical protein
MQRGRKLFRTLSTPKLSRAVFVSGPMTPAPGILNRILFQLFVKDLLPVLPTTVDRHVGDGEVMDDLDGLQVYR